MWFGTWDGLNRYNGYSFTAYRHEPENPHSLSDNTIQSIHEDRSGVLWIGTSDGGLNRFDRDSGQFASYQHDPDDPDSLSNDDVRAIYEDRSGNLWIGTHGGGLDRFDRENERFIHYRHVPDDHRSLSNDHVAAIYEDGSGVLWIGTRGGGLDRFERESEQFTHYRNDFCDPRSLSSDDVVSIYEDRSGVLWIGTWGGGLNEFDRENELFIRYLNDPADPHSLGNNAVTSISEDQSGTLWIGYYTGGLNEFDREHELFIHYRNDPNDPHSLSSDNVRSVYADRSGVLWVGTNGAGLNRYAWEKGFVRYQRDPDDPDSLNASDVFPVCQDREGILWVGTYGGGLNRFDRQNEQFTHYCHDPGDPGSLGSDVVWSIFEDRAGELWLGTSGGGLDRFDRDTEQFVHYRHDPSDPGSLSHNSIFAIHEDRSGVLWIGTLGGGLNRLDRETGRFVRYQHDPGDPHSLSDDDVRSIHEDRAGALWIGTKDGLNRLDRDTGQFTRFRNDPDEPDSLGDNFVLSIHEDRSGTLWIGTDGGGLDRFDPETETFAHYRETEGLPNNVVYGILEDDQGFLWLSTNKGLSRFDPRTETCKNYDARDGLQSNEFNEGSYYRNGEGEMFFGGINGLTAFHPHDIQDNAYAPPIVLTALTQGGQELDPGAAIESVTEVTFRWPKNSFEFEFAALNYVQPEENQYAYMLEGFDTGWNHIGTRRFGRYTNLPGGTYTLRMKGSNSDGLWNEAGASMQVTIVPPFWATWWFRGLIALALVGCAVGGYRLRVRTIQARSRELEVQVRERTSEIERRRQESEALYRADEELYRHLRLDEVLQALVDITVDILQADKSAVMIWDAGQEKLVMQIARGFSPEAMAQLSFDWGEGVIGQTAASGEPVIVENALTDPRRAGERTEALHVVESEGVRSFLLLPIQIGGEVFGVFNVSFTHPHAFSGGEQRLFTALAQRAALVIEKAQLYEQAQESAVVEERSRLARDLHDAVTQTLFSASLIAEALPPIWENDQNEGQRLLGEMRRLSRGALAEMRTLLLELRPAALAEASLGDLLRQLAEAIAGRKDVSVAVKVEGECTLPSAVHVALYRIAQEALNNVVKHAHASQVAVGLRSGGERVELCITDDGCGFDPGCVLPDRLGLGIMRERAQAIGATLTIESEPGHGTHVAVVWEEDK